MMTIRFRLPPGNPRFDPKVMSDDSKAYGSDHLYSRGFETEVEVALDMRVPVVGEDVTVPGWPTWYFTVHSVAHHFGPTGDEPDGETFEQSAYVVLR